MNVNSSSVSHHMTFCLSCKKLTWYHLGYVALPELRYMKNSTNISKECCFISLMYLFATSVSIINLQILDTKPFSLFYETLEFFSLQSVFSLLPRCWTPSCPQRTDCWLCRAVPARPDSLSQNAFLLSQSLPSKLVEEVFAAANRKILPQLEPFARRSRSSHLARGY